MKSPTHVTIPLWRARQNGFNHLTLYLTFPSVKIVEDLDYDTVEQGVARFELDLPTNLRWATDRDFWTVSARLLGFGVTLTRQKGI